MYFHFSHPVKSCVSLFATAYPLAIASYHNLIAETHEIFYSLLQCFEGVEKPSRHDCSTKRQAFGDLSFYDGHAASSSLFGGG